MVNKRYITRQRSGKGFIYFLDGQQISDKATLKYLESIRVPPAWQEVKISPSKRSRILATGVDKAGRLQYIYSPAFRAHQEKAKFERILGSARAKPKMRRITAKHLASKGLNRNKVLACIVRLMDEAYFRVGNEVYAKENQSYGISTVRSKHVDIKGETITFDFRGKSGQHQVKKISDRQLANIIKRLDELPGYEVFKYFDDEGNLKKVTSQEINEYIKELMGEEFSAKDFRTWGGTLLASAELALAKRAESERERKKTVTACVKKVARRLGNTPAITRSSYIDPRIIKSFLESDDMRTIRRQVQKIDASSYLSSEERCVLKLLEKVAVS